MPDGSLLIIEDGELLSAELSRHYRKLGWEVAQAGTIKAARAALLEQRQEPLVMLSDMSLPDGNALDLMEEVRGRGVGGEWVLLTAYGSVPDSVRALRLGATDFLEKPCEMERLDLVLAGAARSARAQRRLRDETAVRIRQYSFASFTRRSAAAQAVRDMLHKLADVPFSALVITGETGTGKGLAARILHHSGRRAEGPLVEINCAALPHDLLESELFGHEAGAFTGATGRRRELLEQAHGGTVFMDEISEMDLVLQAKLLKAIGDSTIRRLGGEREIRVDIQIIAASNLDLWRITESGRFRTDLCHRISAFRLHLPPLRERKEDLEDLVPLSVAEYNAKAVKGIKVIPRRVWTALWMHGWPGNVRELRNVIERCVLLSDNEVLSAEWLQLSMPNEAVRRPTPEADSNRLRIPLDGTMALDEMDRYIIKTTLERNRHNVNACASTGAKKCPVRNPRLKSTAAPLPCG